MAEKMVDKVVRCSRDTARIRNIAIVAHIDHGKTTLSDNLLAGAGMISKELAGRVLQLDFKRDEQERGITIDTSAVSMVHDVDGEEYLINLLDTPGHVDFGGDVTRAMRAVDGCIVLVDAVEGVMPQTETVLRQALRELVRPVLFINKIDRLVTQQQLTPAQIYERFLSLISDVNALISRFGEQPYADAWQVRVQDGTVAFGSALHQWALSLPVMEKTGISVKNIIDIYASGDMHQLAEKLPVHSVMLSLIIHHLPSPAAAQQYRIPKIWHGSLVSAQGAALLACDAAGPVSFAATKVTIEPHQGDIAAGRLFSGTIHRGDVLFSCGSAKKVRVSQLFIFNGAKREIIEEARAGNIIGIAGTGALPGDTLVSCAAGDGEKKEEKKEEKKKEKKKEVTKEVTKEKKEEKKDEKMEPFGRPAHLFEPVVTVSVEPLHARDLSRLADALEDVQKEDPGIRIEVNRETGEYLISGMGELHLDVVVNRLRTEKDVAVTASPPIVVYRESVSKTGSGQGISPDKQHTFSFTAAPLPPDAVRVLKSVPSGRSRPSAAVLGQLAAAGLEQRRVEALCAVSNGVLFADAAREPLPPEARDITLAVFEEVIRQGPLAREPCIAMLVTLTGYSLGGVRGVRGALERAQAYPAVRDGIRAAILSGEPFLLEPKQVMRVDAPEECAGELAKLIAAKRGQLIEMSVTQGIVLLTAKLPVAELFGFSALLRSLTGGRGASTVADQLFEKVSDEHQAKRVAQIRKRKGMCQS